MNIRRKLDLLKDAIRCRMEKERIKFHYSPSLFDHIRKVRLYLKYFKINLCLISTFKLLFQDKVKNMDRRWTKDRRKIWDV